MLLGGFVGSVGFIPTDRQGPPRGNGVNGGRLRREKWDERKIVMFFWGGSNLFKFHGIFDFLW